MKRYLPLLFILFFYSSISFAQNDSLRVLFIGNSYTYANNLPQLCKNLSSSANKTLLIDQNTPGGYTLESHSSNEVTLEKIRMGHWDYVILQEQSQIPTIEYHQLNSMYPAIRRLNDSIKKYNSCTKTMLFMTWGRQYGGQQCDDQGINCSPEFIDFNHMQDSLKSSYTQIANEIGAPISPVGISWKNVLANNNITLHSNDESHPNIHGSYLAACTFYSIFWRQNPMGINYHAGLSAEDALLLQTTANSVVLHSLNDWNMNLNKVKANFDYETDANEVSFTNHSEYPNNSQLLWSFGDGNFSNEIHPIHYYNTAQEFEVQLRVSYCKQSDSSSTIVSIDPWLNTEELDKPNWINIFPNPSKSQMNLSISASTKIHFLELFDSNGQQVSLKRTPLITKTHFPLPQLKNGLYYIRALSLNGIITRKIIIIND